MSSQIPDTMMVSFPTRFDYCVRAVRARMENEILNHSHIVKILELRKILDTNGIDTYIDSLTHYITSNLLPTQFAVQVGRSLSSASESYQIAVETRVTSVFEQLQQHQYNQRALMINGFPKVINNYFDSVEQFKIITSEIAFATEDYAAATTDEDWGIAASIITFRQEQLIHLVDNAHKASIYAF